MRDTQGLRGKHTLCTSVLNILLTDVTRAFGALRCGINIDNISKQHSTATHKLISNAKQIQMSNWRRDSDDSNRDRFVHCPRRHEWMVSNAKGCNDGSPLVHGQCSIVVDICQWRWNWSNDRLMANCVPAVIYFGVDPLMMVRTRSKGKSLVAERTDIFNGEPLTPPPFRRPSQLRLNGANWPGVCVSGHTNGEFTCWMWVRGQCNDCCTRLPLHLTRHCTSLPRNIRRIEHEELSNSKQKRRLQEEMKKGIQRPESKRQRWTWWKQAKITRNMANKLDWPCLTLLCQGRDSCGLKYSKVQNWLKI